MEIEAIFGQLIIFGSYFRDLKTSKKPQKGY